MTTVISGSSSAGDSNDALAATVGAVSRFANVNGVRLHYVERGEGPLILLLHGFPNFWYGWRRQIPALAEAGFRVVAPDLRGYNLSAKPRGVASYAIDRVATDVAALVRERGERRATLVGHDWGGLVGWHLGRRQQQVLSRLVVINAPHPAAFARESRTPEQLVRSSYAAFFQLPRVPELLLRARDFALLERVLRHEPATPGAFTDEDIAAHKSAFARPGALRAMVNYYRAAARRARREAHRAPTPVHCPTLVIWGMRDRYLRERLLDGLEQWVPNLRVERLPGVSHWVPADAPDEVSRLVAEFAA